ncbi:MAG TPA: hypothetical protein VM509_06485 [Planctomycetota bacterium]|nr:hypothetical protein [Planctomycetota bacterium]
MNPALTVRPYEPGDERAILRAHDHVFGHVDPEHRPKSLEVWRWQFEANPAGSRSVVALGARGEVLGQYAGLRQRVHSEVGVVNFTQAIDSMNARGAASGLARTSAFVRAGEVFLERFCGEGADRDHVVYGLTIPSAWRVGAQRLGYEHLRTTLVLAARHEELSTPAAARLVVEESDRCPPDIGELFAVLAAERGVIAVRDRAAMDWRFTRHPAQRYVFGVVREHRALRGVGVFRRGKFAGLEGGLVCDWLAPGADEQAQRALLAWFRAKSEQSGATRLVALFPDTAPEWLAFQRRGFRVLPTEYILATRSFRAPFDRDYLFWRWFYTLADTDLV